MDERHWWVAGRVQETFQIGGRGCSPAVLEEFFSLPENLQLINEFLQAGGHQTLFFFSEAEKTQLTKWDLHIQSDLLNYHSLHGWRSGSEKGPHPTMLYFLRTETSSDVDAARMEREIFCGEIKENPVENLKCLLTELFFPVLRAQTDWGSCSQESVTHFLSGLDKYVAAIQDAANVAKLEKQQILKRPTNIVSPDFLQQRSAILDTDIVNEHEALVSDWIKTIDQVLLEAVDERVLDITTTPLTELGRWHRRQKVLGSIMEQLRGKECKTVIGLLISAKSRLLKKWKSVDISITDASNATKDRVKYLEALYRHFEAMANENDPSNLISSVLPALFNAIKQMETISRFFARNGYLGLLLTKVSNQLAQSCREYIRESIAMKDSEDHLWEKVVEHIENEGELLIPMHTAMHDRKVTKDKTRRTAPLGKSTLSERIQACLALHTYFQEAIRQLRECLIRTPAMRRNSSSSSLSTALGKVSSPHTVKMNKPHVKMSSSITSSFDHHHDYQGTGVPMTDEDTLMYHLETLCRRLKQFIDVILKLHQFKQLCKQTVGVRKPNREDLIEDEGSETGSVNEFPGQEEQGPSDTARAEVIVYQGEPFRQVLSAGGPLQTLIEEDEAQSSLEGSTLIVEQHEMEQDLAGCISDFDAQDLTKDEQANENEDSEQQLSSEEKQMLGNLYDFEDPEDEGLSLSSIIEDKINQMIDTLAQSVDTDILLDIERREHNPFEEGYSEFLVMNQQLERYISVYIQALFLRRMQVNEALTILQRFYAVSHRQGIQPMIGECYMMVFDWFCEDLKEIQTTYETFKEDPVVPRNMPLAAGAIFWSRQLLSRIEGIMKVFRDVRIMARSAAYTHTVKLYNRIATALVGYEALWYQKWMTQVNAGLSGLKVTLLVRNPLTHQLMVNTDMRLLYLIEETKWMTRLGIQVPEAAILAFKQGNKFKQYKSNLEDVLQEYEQLQRKIPHSLADLFIPHLESVNHQFQPGLTNLSWNSVNIEGLLYQANAAVTRFRQLVEKVTEIKEKIIETTLEKITDFDFFAVDEIIAEPKGPEEFIHLMTNLLDGKKTELQNLTTVVHIALSDIILMLQKTKMAQPGSSYNVAVVKTAATGSYSRLHQTLTKAQKAGVAPSTNARSNLQETITDKVLEFFCNQMYEAVYISTCRSLLLLAHIAGCDMEAIMRNGRPFHPLKNNITKVQPLASGTPNLEGTDKPHSFHSFLRDIARGIHGETQLLRFNLIMRFRIPNLVMEPPLEVTQDALNQVTKAIISVSEVASWWSGEAKGQSFHTSISHEATVRCISTHVSEVVTKLRPAANNQVLKLGCYDFLWKDDMNGQCKEFLAANSGLPAIHKEVERFLHIKQQIQEFTEIFHVGCICLDFSLIKDTLIGFAGAWKFQYATILHQQVKENLQAAVKYREEVHRQLTVPVQSLEELNSSLKLLEELQDMENKIDGVYQPIEDMYEELRSYELRIPRKEVTDVKHLRDGWTELMCLASKVKETLLKEKQDIFKQELDKQVKSFVVEVIQFRNNFDTQGPAAPGVTPEEAVSRLHIFQEKFQVYDAKRKTLNSVQRLFNIVPKRFSELDRTGKDLHLLGTLYDLFEKFIDFDQRFRNTLWAEVDLMESNKEIAAYWSECLVWNDKLKDWDAYIEMAGQIKFYEDIFPLLHKLAAKEIRNRHWLQVMAVTGSSFPLEANVFKVFHLLEIGLLKFQDELVSIAKAARKELELEIQMRRVEEEWTEQVLNFEAYKNRGEIFLVKEESLLLLEELEDAQVLLAHMLTSREIDPLREEATSWAEKLKRVGDVLELWIDVQELWQHLEEIFSHATITKELPREARRFAKVDRSWVRMMRSAFNTKNVVQCCCAGDVPKEVILKHVQEELEICSRSLTSYLNRMRQAFPRFYFLCDLALLSLLSHPWDVKYLQHHLRYLFSSVHGISVESLDDDELNVSSDEESVEPPMPIFDFMSVRSGNDGWMSLGQKSVTQMTDSETVFQLSPKSAGVSQEGPHSALHRGSNKGMTVVAVTASDGEALQLDEQVLITSGVEVWLDKLQNTIFRTIDINIWQVIQDVNQGMVVDEWTQKYPTQVSVLGLLYLWTKDCEVAISEMKQDRKALPTALKKYSSMVNRLSAIVLKGIWRVTEETVTHCHKLKLENMILHLIYLRDVMESFTSRKIREVTDFDWKRATRFYLKEKDGHFQHELNILDAQYKYGCEFYGARIPLIMNPTTEKCFLTISQAIQQVNGVALQGEHGVGKTETIKGLSYLLGKFLFLFTCSSNIDLTALSRVLLGTAMDGCWSCFDDFHLLVQDAVSVFMYGAQTIFDTLKAKDPMSALLSGQEIAVDRNCNLFLTVHWCKGFQELPGDVRALFRTVSLCAPDHTILLKGKLNSLCFKSPKALARRLQLIAELVKEQLPEKYHHHFSFQSFLGVIHRATQKRESEKAANSPQNRMDISNDGGRTSRSSSITSVQQNISYGASPSPSLKTGLSTEKNKKPLTSNPLVAAAKESHAIIADALQEVLAPRMAGDNLAVFKQIVRDVFAGMYDPSRLRLTPAINLEKAILTVAEENNLSAHSPWVNKVRQLCNLAQVHPGIIVAGPPGSGKSTCISTLVQALNRLLVNSALGMQDPEKSTAHKLVKINPLSVDDFSLMFGLQTSSHTWVDGIVTYVWRRALRSHSNTWICFDGQLSSSWADTFNSVLGPEKVLQLNNGDHLEFRDSIKLLFETSDLHLASPATVTKAGILFLEGEVLGWQPLAKTWLDGRNQQENTVLSKAFYKTLDPILNFVLHDAKPLVPVTEVGLFRTCTNLLAAMLNDKAQSIGGQLHIERLFVFCLIWSVGGLLDASEMKKYNELIKVYTSVLPDYENEISVFDYYVDESGEWDTWQSRLPEMTYIGSTDILGEVFVPTLDTMIVRTFMEYASMGDQPVLLIGPPGSGKTAMINDFMNTQDRSNLLIKRMVFSGSTKASDLQQLIETNIVHRQGFIYGARNGKSFQMFIDDINLPQPDSNGVQPCNELLRLLLDDKVLVKLSKPFEWQSLQGLVVQAAMALPQYANSPQRICAKRLLRHFAIFHLPDPKGLQLQNVIFSILEANLGDKEGLPLAEELHIALVNASCQLLEAVKKALLPSPTPGRQHYLFSLRDINRAFQCLQRLSSEDREDSTMVVSFWHHELHRILGDRLSRRTDQNWFNKELTQAVQENFPDIPVESLRNLFVIFPLEMTFSHQTSAGNLNKGIKVLLQPVQQLDEVKDCLQTYLQHYNEELGHQKLQIELSENIVEQIIRIYRVLACEYSGNLLLIGSVGSHLRTLVKLSLYVADVSIHPMDTSGHHNFLNSLKSAIQLSAVEGNATAILLTAQEIADEYYLDAINSLLICGDYPSLFSTEEMSDLLQVLGPALRRKHPNQVYDPAKYLVSQVKYNLHMILCLPPHHELLQTAAGKYPGFLCGCQVIWIDNWSPKTIHSEASYYIAKHHILELYPKDIRENVAVTISQIHSSMLKECNQIPWVGSHREHKLLSSTDLHGDESAKMEQKNLTDLPFAKDIIQERIQLLNKGQTKEKNNEVFLGPSTLRSFLESFKYIYLKKRVELEETEKGLRKVLETLAQTRIDAKETQVKISIISQEHEESEVTVIESFNKLIAKASALERLKAELGIGGEILQVFLSQNESELEDDEDAKELLKEEEADEYDEAFWAMKEASSVSRIHEIIKKIEKVKSELEEVRSSLKNVKNQVMHWCRKVDKGCIERLLRCQNPPYLVGQVLEMVLVMVDSLPFGDGGVDPLRSTRQPIENADDKGSGQIAGSSTTKPVRAKRKDRGIGKDSKDKVDKAKWKSLQYRIGDSSKIIEMLLNVATLEDGLPPHTLKDVESYLGKAKDGLQGVTGEGSLLEDAAPHATPQSITPAKKYVHSDGSPTRDTSKGGITIASARYSSEDAATLVTFVIAVIEYTRLCGPLRDCLRRLSELEKEKEECSKEEVKVSIVTEKREEGPPTPVFQERRILTVDDLPTLEIEVQQLQAEYDVAVVRKHKLQNELHSHQERLQAALDVMKSLSIQEQDWKETVEQSSLSELLTNCIIAAAFLTYCTPLSVDRRKSVIGFLFNVCENCGLTIPPRLLLKDVNLMQFLHSPIELKKLEMKGLPQNRLALDNSCVLTNAQGSSAWVLVCDPTAQAIQWMKDHLPDACTEVQHHELRSHLDSCLTDGLTLLLTYCDTQILSKDARFSQVIRSKSEFIRNKVPFKIMVADHEVECHPGFHMYLHTTSLPQEIPPEVAAFCSILYFSQDNEGLVEQLLDRFVLKEKPRLKEEQSTLEQECLNNMEELSALERRMVTTLQSDSTLLRNLAVTKKLSDLKQQHEEALEMKLKIDASQKTILHVREGFREIAVRGTVMFDTTQRFRQFNIMYQTSFSQLLELFDLSVAHSERSSVKGVLASLTHNIFAYVTKSLLEKDRLVYALLVTFEVEESLGHLKPGEKEFAISPDLCVAVLQKLGVKPSESRHQAKNPFDWMSETQFKNVQILAMYYSWFGDLFDRMYRDGKDLTWKAFCESEQPEHPTKGRWPEGLDELTPLQCFLVLRAVRPDRSLQSASAFISGTLGKMYTTEFTVDLQTMSPQSPQRPSLLIYSSDSSIALKLILELAERRNHKTLVFPITNTEEAEKRVKELLKQGMSEGCWVILENIQNSINVMTSLEEIIKENKNPDKNFHLWISAQASPFLPVRLLHYTVKIVVDMPKSVKGGLMQSWRFVDPEAISRTRRPEMPAILHNVCILHCAVRLRTEFGVTAGWNYPGMLFFGCTELTEALQLLTKEFKDDQESASGGQVVVWTAIRYLLSEVIYGRNVTDDCDTTCLTSMIEYWISPGTTKKDCELTKLKYKIPAAFFNTDIHMASLMQSLDTIPQYTLDTPEVFHMHPSPAVPFGQEDYVFSHLRVLYDSVQFCKEWEQTMAQSTQVPQKRRTSMTRHPPMGVVKFHVAQTATGSLLRQLTMAELWEVCSSLITKIPRGWSRDTIMERLKILGGNTPFNLFIKKELEQLMSLLSEVRRNLQVIKNALESESTLGDQLSDPVMSVVNDLHHKRTPAHWCAMGNNISYPPELSASAWMSEVQQQVAHFEKILHLGRDKMPSYWLGAFRNPKGLLSVLKQETIRQYSERTGNSEPIVFKTEITQRDKDHIRDPPHEGMFIYGIHIWGISWNKTDAELLDAAPRQNPCLLPVIHLHCMPLSEKTGVHDPMKASDSYACPVYISSTSSRDPILHLDIQKENVPSARWALRGLKATIHPF